MENRAYALATGVFVLVLGALLLAVSLWLAGGTPAGGRPYDLITQRSVAGLTPGAVVRLHGVEVGEVESIGFDPLDPRRVRVRTRISSDAPVMQGSWARLTSLGLSGTPYIELGYPANASKVLPTSSAAPARIPLSPAGLTHLSDSGDELVQSLQVTLARLNAFLTPANAEQISQLLQESHEAVAQLKGLGRELRPAARRAERVLQAAHEAVEDADALLVAVHGRVGALDSLREGGDAVRELQQRLVQDTLPEISELMTRLELNSETLEQLLREVRDRPQSVLFGVPPEPPGPGEPGFHARQ